MSLYANDRRSTLQVLASLGTSVPGHPVLDHLASLRRAIARLSYHAALRCTCSCVSHGLRQSTLSYYAERCKGNLLSESCPLQRLSLQSWKQILFHKRQWQTNFCQPCRIVHKAAQPMPSDDLRIPTVGGCKGEGHIDPGSIRAYPDFI